MSVTSFKTKFTILSVVSLISFGGLTSFVPSITPPIAFATQVKTSSIKLNENQAVEKFNQKFPNTDINKISLKVINSKYQYKISGFNSKRSYVAKIDAKTGNVTSAVSEKGSNSDSKGSLDLTKTIRRTEANHIAEKAVKNSKGIKWQLESKDDTVIWKVTVRKGSQKSIVKINALDKKVISINKI